MTSARAAFALRAVAAIAEPRMTLYFHYLQLILLLIFFQEHT